MSESKNLWGGRFTGEGDQAFVEFNRSFSFDRRLLALDVRGSIAHCHALREAGILLAEEAGQIEHGLQQILELTSANPDFYAAPAEDVHSFVEAQLVALIGDPGRKLHAGRSRNDQVATDLRLWLREAIDDLAGRLRSLQNALLDLAEANVQAVLPGYTHLQRAQPILFAHWCLAYFEMLERDYERLRDTRVRVNVLPLGAAALAGTSLSN